MRLIYDDELIRIIRGKKIASATTKVMMLDAVEECPTVDAVPVVRCETCKHWSACESEENDCDIYGVCNQIGRLTIFDWFCADGEAGTYEDA